MPAEGAMGQDELAADRVPAASGADTPAAPGGRRPTGPCQTPRPPLVGRASDLPNPNTWAIHLARGAMETLVGRRTGPQLSGWATDQAISEFTGGAPQVDGPGRIRTARVTSVGPARVEAVVLIDFGERTRALAMRLIGVNMPIRPYQRHRPGPRWMATSLRLL